MSTVQEIQSDIASKTAESDRLFNESTAFYEKGEALRSQLSALIRQSRVGLSNEQIANITSQQDALRLEIRTVTDEEEALARQAAQLAREVKQLEFDLKKAQQDAAAKEAELNNTPGSAGSGAPTQSPELPPASVNERLNTQQAAALAGETETGTNPPVKKLTETQSVSPDDSNITGANTAAPSPPTAGGAPGVGSSAESDGTDGTDAANIRQIMANFDNNVFLPKDNVLDQYASYTYNIGWYLLSPENYKALITTKKPNIATYSLLAQSGGAPTGSEPSDAGGVRNQFFNLDYYIDDLEITSVVTGKGSMRAHNYQELSFSVTEPASITLIPALQQAVDTVNKNGGVQYQLATYCLVIKFYGYDADGKLVQASNGETNGAVVEKFIPFYIKDIKFRIENKLVQYDVKASAINYYVGFGTAVGTTKASIEISGTTVGQVLSGTALNAFANGQNNTTQPAPNVPVDYT